MHTGSGCSIWKSEDARANGLDCCNYDQIMISESYVVERYDRKLRLKYLDGTEKSPSRRRKTDVLLNGEEKDGNCKTAICRARENRMCGSKEVARKYSSMTGTEWMMRLAKGLTVAWDTKSVTVQCNRIATESIGCEVILQRCFRLKGGSKMARAS
ncbi:predicted protein [Sclerotinia sclerotiorum 1980 UF-70]|uniref:Uncharacterized protein n=1 Tax=Sclerotinia sclerotiorum (strain ATCC 18683 / 1980 / Ss-1) TaxID=665079 RepID=A7E5K4_SCLS1|nr:predicted protein [Sclerotinia sclerotiorum 1980 UF-70]EDN91176.1 predicted protein [Sclerotinia sclerotiorum 1980 UF-70]